MTSFPLDDVTTENSFVKTLSTDFGNSSISNVNSTKFQSTASSNSVEVNFTSGYDVTDTQSTTTYDVTRKGSLLTAWTQNSSQITEFESQTWNDPTESIAMTSSFQHPVDTTSAAAVDGGTDAMWNAVDKNNNTAGTAIYSIVATIATVALLAAVITLIARRVTRLLDTGNGIYLPTNHVNGSAGSYVSVGGGGDSPTGRLDYFYAELNSSSSCWCCVCRLCCLWRYHCARSTNDDGSTANGNKYDYIYRPLGGIASGSGSRIEEEYETTFVGVSIPLLHEVSDI